MIPSGGTIRLVATVVIKIIDQMTHIMHLEALWRLEGWTVKLTVLACLAVDQ